MLLAWQLVGLTLRLTVVRAPSNYSGQAVVWGLAPWSGSYLSGALVTGKSGLHYFIFGVIWVVV